MRIQSSNMSKSYLLLTIIFAVSVHAQIKKEWFPSGLNIQPFAANFLEPRAGFNYLVGEKNIRLDIGTSSDIYKIQYENTTLTFGADVFTYTRLRSENNFKFPVEAVDYLFGLNAGYKIVNENKSCGFRFRFAHISAHLVDGSFDQNNYVWRDGGNPSVFSKEFFELFPFYRIEKFRVYVGLTYIFHVVPSQIGKGIYQFGFDNYFTSLTNVFTLFAGYDFKLQNTGSFTGANILTAGIKFGSWDRKGFSISFSYFTGKSIHGEYFDLNENYASLGFNMDL